MKRIYMDNAATSVPKAPGVAEAVYHYLADNPYNVGRGGYEEAYQVTEKVGETRKLLQEIFHAPGDAKACFTSGVTESLNFFIHGFLKEGDFVLTSSMEHNSVMRPLQAAKGKDVRTRVISCLPDGTIPLEDLEEQLKSNKVRALIMTGASNVCGTVMPIREAGALCRKYGACFCVDTAQTAGILPIDMEEEAVDFLAFSGHKGLRGPQGIGGFLVRQELADQIIPTLQGGTGSRSDSELQPFFLPDRFESGTLNLPGIMGLREALLYRKDKGFEEETARLQELTSRFLNGLCDIPEVKVAGISDPEEKDKRIGVISVDFSPLDNGMAAFLLEQNYGIMTRTGLHCAPRAHQTLGTYPQGTVRFSFGPDTDSDQVTACIKGIQDVIDTMMKEEV